MCQKRIFAACAIGVLAVGKIGKIGPAEPTPTEYFMPGDQREALARAYIEDAFNQHNLARLDKYMDADLVSHWLGDRTIHGLPAWKEVMASFFAAFPDAAYTLDDLFFAGDKEMARYLACDPPWRLGRNRRYRPLGKLDRHHHRPVRRRQVGELGRVR